MKQKTMNVLKLFGSSLFETITAIGTIMVGERLAP
jgi:hypothetical protein